MQRRRLPAAYQRIRARAKALKDAEGQHYDPRFLSPADRQGLVDYLATLHPLWEQRYSAHHPPPPGQAQRGLLRPVYWLGNWQFACLGYYHPPQGVQHRCVKAEPFPPLLAKWVKEIERITRVMFEGPDLPKGWHLNTCLVNLYGSRREGEKWVDTARVGEHKDFEPGPGRLGLDRRARAVPVRREQPARPARRGRHPAVARRREPADLRRRPAEEAPLPPGAAGGHEDAAARSR